MPSTTTGTLASVRSSVETLGENRVKLTVEVPEAELEVAIDDAFKRLAGQIRMPGFRPGRAPRRLLEAQLGHQTGRSEALKASVPEYYARAVIEHDVDAIALPEIEITNGQESGSMSFGAVVEVRPCVSIAGYENLRIEIPGPSLDEADVSSEIDRFRGTFAELVPVNRPAVDGDHVTVDITGTVGAETIDGLTASDYDYEVGTGAVVAEIDENLRGARAGDILEFEAEHPDPEEALRLCFRVLVKEVSETVLPDFDDELVAAHTEYGTATEFRVAVENRQSSLRVLQCRMAREQGIVEALADLVSEDPPEAMIENEVMARMDDLDAQLQRQGRDLESTGRSVEEITEQFREPAIQAAKVDLALRAVASAEGLVVEDGDVEGELEELADDSAVDVEVLRSRLTENGRMSALRIRLSKRAALGWVVGHAVLVDPEGEVVDPELLELPADGDPGETGESVMDVLEDDVEVHRP